MCSLKTKMNSAGYASAINVWLTKPHVINKRLWGSNLVHSIAISLENTELHLNRPTYTCPVNIEDKNVFIHFLLSNFNINVNCNNTEADTIVKLIKLLPKNLIQGIDLYSLVFIKSSMNATFIYNMYSKWFSQNITADFPYSIQLSVGELHLKVCYNNGVEQSKMTAWLANKMLPQILKWGEESIEGQELSRHSLTLVNIEKYYLKYNELKEKYGKKMVSIWPECTDPEKFVYEDIAIATYLLLLWQQENSDNRIKQSFVDLGCGNGLLVYILASEGYSGYGIDVRKRHIWDLYPDHIKLMEKTITPSDKDLFPDIDWVIGNHSDELTPWIPVIAAKSSYKCNFFLLPCCSYNFNGTKYQRRNSGKSQYLEYLDYIKSICDICQIETKFDRLKIPSTKRICLVGCRRNYNKIEHNEICDNIQIFINENNTSVDNCMVTNKKDWIPDFKPRDQIVQIRNCTQIDKNVINEIIELVTKQLLKDFVVSKDWYSGNPIKICEIVELIPEMLLKSLKFEAGGLQTLLRNNHHIFCVQSGFVKLRYPQSIDDVMKRLVKKRNGNNKPVVKKRPCWFFVNHPQGCPLADEICSFTHINKIN